MQEYGLLALLLTRQRSAQTHGIQARNSWLDGGSQLPPLRLDAYEAARIERLRGPGGQEQPGRVSRLLGAVRGRDTKIESLRGLALFSSLSDRELREVAQLVDTVVLPSGHTFIREGESGREFFVIAEGTVSVSQQGRPLAELGPGGWVGEIALMSAIPRTATVATRTPAKLFVATEIGFRQLVRGWQSVAAQIDQGLAERAAA
jgi:CRP/FNR family transcriptional regulator, cyclic AMP receptor protein